MIDFEDGTLGIQQSDKLDHRVQRDARQFLTILFARVTRQQFRAPNLGEIESDGWIRCHLSGYFTHPGNRRLRPNLYCPHSIHNENQHFTKAGCFYLRPDASMLLDPAKPEAISY